MIRIRTLGPLDITVDGAAAAAEVLWRKHAALLVYLARSPGRGRARDHLINLLWADKTDDAARHSLNEAVRVLRRHAGDCVDRQQERIQLTEHSVVLDVDEMDLAIASDDYQTASGLIGGEFMDGFTVADCWEFDDWLARERTHWRERSLLALTRYAHELLARGAASDALRTSERALMLDAGNEDAARIKLTALSVLGERTAALRFFEEFKRQLDEQLGCEPSPATLSLGERIRAERVWAHAPEGMLHPSVRRAPLIGRHNQVKKLTDLWRRCSREAHGGLAVIEGETGTGKTRLLEELAVRARLDGAHVTSVRALAGDTSADIDIPTLLRIPAGDTPLLLCIDDAHFLDAANAALLPAVLRGARRSPIVVALAVLPRAASDELHAAIARIDRDFDGVLVRTTPFDSAELRALAEWSLPGTDEEQLDRVVRRVAADSAGQPFLAVELLHAVAHGLEITGAGAWPLPAQTFEQALPGALPDAVLGAFRVSFRKLSAEAQSVLIAAAVLPTPVRAQSLQQATGLPRDRLDSALDELEWQRWLAADARGYAFVARVARDVVVADMMTEGQRQRILQVTALSPA